MTMAIRGRLFRLLSNTGVSAGVSTGVGTSLTNNNNNNNNNNTSTTNPNNNNIQEVSIQDFLEEVVTKKQMIILGEYHGSNPTIQLQTAIQEAMAHSLISSSDGHGHDNNSKDVASDVASDVTSDVTSDGAKVRVVMEHFSVDMQPLLQRYIYATPVATSAHTAINIDTTIDTTIDTSIDTSTNSTNNSMSMSTEELITKYHEIGTEQHNLTPYIPLFESAKNYNANNSNNTNNTNNSNDAIITLHGGFIPRPFARQLHILTKKYAQEYHNNNNNNNNDKSDNHTTTTNKNTNTNTKTNTIANAIKKETIEYIQQLKEKNYISPNETLHGTNDHYNYFESLFTQRNIHLQQDQVNQQDQDPVNQQEQSNQNQQMYTPNQRFRTLFPSQILKDASMAWNVHDLCIKSNNNNNNNNNNNRDKYFIICGVGHMLYSHGVPERILSLNDHYVNMNTKIANGNGTDNGIGNGINNGIDNDNDNGNQHIITNEKDMLRIACLPVSKGTLTSSKNNNKNKNYKNNHNKSMTIVDNEKKCPHDNTNNNDKDDKDMEMISSILQDAYGPTASNAADICFLYEEEEYDEYDNEEEDVFVQESAVVTSQEKTTIKDDTIHTINTNINEKNNINDNSYNIQQETKNAYDKVGSTASQLHKGNMKKAYNILKSLHYNENEIEYAGLDIVNYQGVGCPHRHANIQPGEYVLDMGSGLGVDSIIASKSVLGVNDIGHGHGDEGGLDKNDGHGRVVGVDLSLQCVNHANNRVKERGLNSIISFVQSPIESIGNKINNNDKMNNNDKDSDNSNLNDSDSDNDNDKQSISFDVIISNGAFCLLPNKQMGFKECYRLLKSGGRIVICTTVIQNNDGLEDDVDWPLCMQTFAKIDELEPMLKEIGFEDIDIDLSDSLMEVEVEVEVEEGEDEEDEEDEECSHMKSSQNKTNNEEAEEEDEGRYKIHNEEGRKRYRHLEKFDMNELCARVVIKARKP